MPGFARREAAPGRRLSACLVAFAAGCSLVAFAAGCSLVAFAAGCSAASTSPRGRSDRRPGPSHAFFSWRIDGRRDRAADLRVAGEPLLTLLGRAVRLGGAAGPPLLDAAKDAARALDLRRAAPELRFTASFWDAPDEERMELALEGPAGALRICVSDVYEDSRPRVDGHLDRIAARWQPRGDAPWVDAQLWRSPTGWVARITGPSGSVDYLVIAGEVETLAAWAEAQLYRPRTGDRFRALWEASPAPPRPRPRAPLGTSFPTGPGP